jgi:RHS repeat-associated protein
VNRRIEKVVAGESHVHYFYNQGWQLLEEIYVDGGGVSQLTNQYVWSPRYIDAPIVRHQDGNADGDYLDVGDNVRYYLSDANFNTTAVVDAGTGDVMARYVYDPYGKVTVYSATWTSPAAPVADGVLYCGYFLDAETGLYSVRHREYVTSVSTWAQRDPLGYDGDINLYRYTHNLPTHSTDPFGTLNVTRVGTPRLAPGCGGTAVVDWQFVLWDGAHHDGYFVQQVDVRCEIDRSCKKCPRTSPIKPDYSFWEAFPVKEHSAGNSLDSASQGVPHCTCGNYSSVAYVKFFFKTTTGDLSANGWKTGLVHPPGKTGDCTAHSHQTLSTDTKPAWFDKPSDQNEGTKSDVLTVWWNCCLGLGKSFVRAFALP